MRTIPTVKGPRLFGVHNPVENTETRVGWQGTGWNALIQDTGPTWAAYWCGISIGTAYANRKAAKNGIENHVRRVAKCLRNAMGTK